MSTETLEEAANRMYEPNLNCQGEDSEYCERAAFVKGAEWQAKRMYSDEDLVKFMQFILSQEPLNNTSSVSGTTAMYYIEQFKKK